MLRFPIVSVFLLLMIIVGGCAESMPDQGERPGMITEATAIEIATTAIEGKVDRQQGSPITVKVTPQGVYIVTFVYINPPGGLGPDYDAQVTIDGKTGDVLLILAGS